MHLWHPSVCLFGARKFRLGRLVATLITTRSFDHVQEKERGGSDSKSVCRDCTLGYEFDDTASDRNTFVSRSVSSHLHAFPHCVLTATLPKALGHMSFTYYWRRVCKISIACYADFGQLWEKSSLRLQISAALGFWFMLFFFFWLLGHDHAHDGLTTYRFVS